MSQLQRIQKMEEHLNKYSQVLARAQVALAELERCQSDYIQLRDYYTSQDFFDDLTFSNRPDFPADVACGVLAEDTVYDLMGEHFQTALTLLDLSSVMLKER
ncbi:DUF4298 domain-containing protein [Streptococcus sinensis]|uniref:DUF4298 domain-containing protein n=1 Tax=Streptococcus sinensis TaxID=176090 RepID=UPI001C2E6B9F|nr:DUF4298 domain-containing protein [Streptococcus sinensis]MCD1277524.1 hypothetical protein [Streptococcus sinensis]